MNKKTHKKSAKKSPLNDAPKPGRRDFMKTAWKGLGIIGGLEFTGLTLHYLIERGDNSNNKNLFDAGSAAEFPKNSVTPFRRGKFYLVRLADGGFMALSLKCSHLGCAVIWDEKAAEFICPCHSSKFNRQGDVVSPPAPRALDVYDIEVTSGKLMVNLNKKSKRERFDKSQLTYI